MGQLQQTFNAKLVKYRRDAVQQSRQKRCGLKPTAYYKRKLMLSMDDKRTYEELRAAFLRQGTYWEEIQAAENEQESQNLVEGKNFEVSLGLRTALATDSPQFSKLCRGCLRSNVNRLNCIRLALPFCTRCSEVYCRRSMIGGFLLSTLKYQR